jgi:hypothetical protein
MTFRWREPVFFGSVELFAALSELGEDFRSKEFEAVHDASWRFRPA